jgi:hypothetical protein
MSARTAQLTGAQLATALLPAADFPAGYTGSRTSSGTRLETSRAKHHLATMSCGSFGSTFSFQGFGQSAWAVGVDSHLVADDIANRSYLETVYQFGSPAAAASFFHGLRAAFIRCPEFIYQAGGPELHVSTTAPVDGHPAFQAIESPPRITGIPVGPIALASVDILSSVAGTDVFTVLSISDVSSLTGPAPRSLLTKLIPRVLALR